MNKDDHLPFEVGQRIEARSFIQGYRGAWFRSQIKQMRWKNGYKQYLLKYFDFPDEKEKWTKLYQVSPYRKRGEPNRLLMVRPQYPTIYHESQMPDINSIQEVIVVITGGWSVGDLVDWLTDDCYWSGKLTKLLGDGKAEMDLLPQPMGEGLSYEVSFRDLRPSLDWSPEDGWRVVTATVGGKYHQCARLICPVVQADGDSSGIQMASVLRTNDSHVEDRLPSAQTLSSHVSMKSSAALGKTVGTSEVLDKPSRLMGKTGGNMDLVQEVNVSEKMILVEKKSSLLDSGGLPKIVDHVTEEDLSNSCCPLKKLRTSRGNALDFKPDTLENALLGLEEILNNIKWLKGLVGVRRPSDERQHSWKFIENRVPSMQK